MAWLERTEFALAGAFLALLLVHLSPMSDVDSLAFWTLGVFLLTKVLRITMASRDIATRSVEKKTQNG